ncbi:MAG: thioredoxin domain-containing protein, partial [Bdellovibrionota bacterium]
MGSSVDDPSVFTQILLGLRFRVKLIYLIGVFLVFVSASLDTWSQASSNFAASGNHLKNEKSPYLKQHAGNPVWWHPWGRGAFEQAQKENKLIFLSIGYSTCHWCHVMERESFADSEVADALNGNLISVKVDREERPDVDAIYMDAVQAMNGFGGWPLNVLLTPDRKPFIGGAYFSKDQLISLISQSVASWKKNPADIRKDARNMGAYLKNQQHEAMSGEFTNAIFSAFFRRFKKEFDPIQGGRAGSLKFIPSYELRVLLRIYRRTGNEDALAMVRTTLEHAGQGGIFDAVGGGFHRYSTDDHWLVPHFEKMLYDQAALAMAYLEAFQVTKEPEYERVVREILDYVLRDLRHSEGGFFSAEDADSDGAEGKFYVWTQKELKKILTDDEFNQLAKAYGVSAQGNFENQANLLNLQPGFLRSKRSQILQSAVEKLREVRATRAKPHRDEKILV